MSLLPQYYGASFGDLPLIVVSFRSNGGRDVAIQSPSRGDAHTLHDRGKVLRSTSCELVFAGADGQYVAAFRAFKAAAEDGTPKAFVHPLDGVYMARVSSLDYSADANEEAIRCSVTFLEEQEQQVQIAVEMGAPNASGPEAVGVAVLASAAALDGIASALTPQQVTATQTALAQTADTVNAWSLADALDTHQVFLGVATLTATLDNQIDALEQTLDPNQWQAYKALVMLRFEVTRAGEAATQAVQRMFDFHVTADLPLTTICAEVFGADKAIAMAEMVASINRIATPGAVPAGTILKMPTEASA